METMGAMKYIIFTVLAIVLSFAGGYLLVRIVTRVLKKRMPRVATIIASVLSGIALVCVCGFVYLQFYYHATPEALAALESGDGVTVTHEDGAYAFDGPGTDSALVFYPGAKVEAKAYAPLMRRLAVQGLDCFLVEMPLNMAFFGMDRAGAIMVRHSYGKWIMAGHSLGGIAASSFASSHAGEVSGLVLLASYPSGTVNNGLGLCLVYGTEDKVLNRDAYEASRPNWPSDARETVIQGGNHAQFGNYGEQAVDGVATISATEQQSQAADAILAFV